MIKDIFLGVLGAGFILASIMWSISEATNKKLGLELHATQIKLSVEKTNNVSLSASIQEQNKAIETISVDRDKNLEAYMLQLQVPEKVRFETKYQTKYKYVEVKSNECKDIIDHLDDIKLNGF